MKSTHRCLVILFLLVLAAPLGAQQPVCPTMFPPTSPVFSSSPDDIPPTDVDITTYTGATAKGRANHNISYVEIGPNDQRVWFGVDAAPGLFRTFYNRRVRANSLSPWQWQYSSSPVVIEYQAPASAGPATVLYSSTAKYRDTTTSNLYEFLMYQVFQPGSCDGVVAGFLYVSFSHDGICWTPPRKVTRPGGPSFPCYPQITDTVPIEAMSAVDGGNTLYLVGVEGDIQQLAPPVTVLDLNGEPRRYNNMDRTLTAIGTASVNDPALITILGGVSAAGMLIPDVGPANGANPNRYKGYAYFMNLQTAWDPTTGDFYLGRGYPYPYDRGSLQPIGRFDPPTGGNTPTTSQTTFTYIGPSPVVGCLPTPGTLPNRIQIYRMNIGSLSNFTQLSTGTWTLALDAGGAVGYGFDSPSSATTPLVMGQTNSSRDWGAVSFLRNREGNLVRYGTTAYFFGADTYKQSKGMGPCRVTGNERVLLGTIP